MEKDYYQYQIVGSDDELEKAYRKLALKEEEETPRYEPAFMRTLATTKTRTTMKSNLPDEIVRKEKGKLKQIGEAHDVLSDAIYRARTGDNPSRGRRGSDLGGTKMSAAKAAGAFPSNGSASATEADLPGQYSSVAQKTTSKKGGGRLSSRLQPGPEGRCREEQEALYAAQRVPLVKCAGGDALPMYSIPPKVVYALDPGRRQMLDDLRLKKVAEEQAKQEEEDLRKKSESGCILSMVKLAFVRAAKEHGEDEAAVEQRFRKLRAADIKVLVQSVSNAIPTTLFFLRLPRK